MSAHVTSKMYYFQHSKNHPNLQFAAVPIYITMGSNDYGIFILMFPWHVFIQCIVVVLTVGLELNMCSEVEINS